MPGLIDLVDLISLDVTRGLVQQGLGLGFDGRRFTRTGSPSALAITNATNATPIVLTCAQPHTIPLTRDGAPNALHAVVAGVEGNTAANAVDTDPRSRTRGINRGVCLTPISATEFEMSVPDPTTGLLAPIAGSGTYTIGGTITPALTEGRILFGREHARFEQSAPPWLAFVPAASVWGPRAVAHGAVGFTEELHDELEQRSLGTELVVLELHTWGAAFPPYPRADFDITQRLYQQVIQSVHLLCPGAYQLLDKGVWDDQKERATQIIKYGHYHVMTIGFATPILEFAMPFVETPIAIEATTLLQPLDGSSPEVGCTDAE